MCNWLQRLCVIIINTSFNQIFPSQETLEDNLSVSAECLLMINYCHATRLIHRYTRMSLIS